MRWQWHQLDHMQIICTSLQTDDHARTSSLSLYIPDVQLCYSTEQMEETDSFCVGQVWVHYNVSDAA